jgi:hypothetical protein
VCFPLPSSSDGVTQTYLRGHRLRVERKEYTMRRNMRMGIISRSPRQLQPILVHLYNQALQMGLPQELSVRILSLNRQEPRIPSGVGNPNHASSATGNPAPGPIPPIGPIPPPASSPFPAPYGTIGNHQLATPLQSNFGYPQLVTPQSAPLPPAHYRYEQYPNMQHFPSVPAQMMPSIPPHTLNDGTTYYTNSNQQHQAPAPYGSMPLQPMFGPGYGFNHQHQPFQPMNPIQEANENEHTYSHEMFAPNNPAGEAYGSEPYTYPTDHGHGHGHGHQ